jgi:phosphohistidine phosphatase SixA
MSLPDVILVMRHAEKPDDLNDDGLSDEGTAHAAKLASYIPKILGGPPDVIFAAADSKHSKRPRETVELLAKQTRATFDATIPDAEYHSITAKLRNGDYAGKKVVVCWHHGHIPGIMGELGASQGDYFDRWPENLFNLVLKVEYPRGACKVTWLAKDFSTKSDP